MNSCEVRTETVLRGFDDKKWIKDEKALRLISRYQFKKENFFYKMFYWKIKPLEIKLQKKLDFLKLNHRITIKASKYFRFEIFNYRHFS